MLIVQDVLIGLLGEWQPLVTKVIQTYIVMLMTGIHVLYVLRTLFGNFRRQFNNNDAACTLSYVCIRQLALVPEQTRKLTKLPIVDYD
jgi:hypothetical protein